MASGFKSGVYAIPAGALDIEVSGISLSFTPVSVQVSVRQPEADSDLITAYVVGTPGESGFAATLSSPAPSEGYVLEWTAFSDEAAPSPIEGDTLQVDYSTLVKEVSRFLGYDPAALTAAQADAVDSYIQSGVRRFYYPPAMEGVDPSFEWSFLRQDGEVDIVAGTSEYTLPNGFGRIAGQLIFRDSEARHTVPVIPYGDIRRMLDNPGRESGRPRFSAMTSVREFGSRGQTKKLFVYPVPDRAYTLSFSGDADNGKLDAVDRPYPLGGAMFSELVIESCLAVAEQKANDESGLHTQNFNSLLVSMIQRDRKSGAQIYGKMGDPRHRFYW